MAVTSVRLQPEVETGLEDISSKLQRSKSWLINQALREFIARQDLEDARWTETIEALNSLGKGNYVFGDAVHSWLKTWGTDHEASPPKAGQ